MFLTVSLISGCDRHFQNSSKSGTAVNTVVEEVNSQSGGKSGANANTVIENASNNPNPSPSPTLTLMPTHLNPPFYVTLGVWCMAFSLGFLFCGCLGGCGSTCVFHYVFKYVFAKYLSSL
ncbi:MAG: hypothetical protein LE169_02975 [Endomicrobium sp.]|nr:hypothetical protein [Endomicrobium sp.]